MRHRAGVAHWVQNLARFPSGDVLGSWSQNRQRDRYYQQGGDVAEQVAVIFGSNGGLNEHDAGVDEAGPDRKPD